MVPSITLALWLADPLQGISPAWIGLGAATICLLPSLELVSPTCRQKDIGHGGLLFLAVLMGLGAIIAEAGLGQAVATALTQLPPLADTLALQTGLSRGAVLMTRVVAFSSPLLPYQIPPLIVAKEIGQIPCTPSPACVWRCLLPPSWCSCLRI